MHDSPEVEFLRGYKDAVMHFNRLDRNLAYFLRTARSVAGREADIRQLLSKPYDIKLKQVKSTIRSHGFEREFADFLALAATVRTWRNRLVHGDWNFAARAAAPIRFHVPAPFEESGGLTMQQFQRQVTELNRANALFIALQQQTFFRSRNTLHGMAHATDSPTLTPRAFKFPRENSE